MKKFGNLPVDLGKFHCLPGEVFYYLYLPISLRNSSIVTLPKQLEMFRPLIQMVKDDNFVRFYYDYVYISAKRMIASPEQTANRPGWHADGFGSNDLNYVWYDALPTVFNDSDFDISDDHLLSLSEFAAQAKPSNDKVYPCYSVLKLDSSVVHRVALATKPVMRTFVKISISPNEYNLIGNSVNHDLDYRWTYYPRQAIRNDPARAQLDYLKVKSKDLD